MKDCFKINTKQRINMPNHDECVGFKNYESQIKSLLSLLITFKSRYYYADLESILVLENNKK